MVALLLAGTAECAAGDFELTLRHHSNYLTFGDPLYVESVLVNGGDEAVWAPRPNTDLNTFHFEFQDAKFELITRTYGGALGIVKPVLYEPGKRVTSYWQVYLPRQSQSESHFWSLVRRQQTVYVAAGFTKVEGKASAGVLVRSGWEEVRLEPRKAEELRILNQFHDDKSEYKENLPIPKHFGLPWNLDSHEKTMTAAKEMPDGEIADLLDLTLQLQELHASPDDAREAGNRALVDWLKKQPDIKRQYLTQQVWEVASACHMKSTAKIVANLRESQESE
jgi:hypothetical protein